MILDERTEFCDATALNTGAAGSYLIGDVVEAVEDVAEVVEAVTPVVAIAKTVVKATKGKKKAK